MSLIARKSKSRPWPVTVKLQSANEAGDILEIESTFVAMFRPLSEADYAAIDAALDETHPRTEPPPPIDAGATVTVDGTVVGPVRSSVPISTEKLLRRNAAYFAQLIDGWGPEVVDEASGMPVPFSAAELTALITGTDGLAVSAALWVATAEIRYGGAARKNSPTSPAPGPAAAPADEVPGPPAATSPTT